MLGPQEKILRKISSTTSMHEFNIMRRNIEQMYESSVYNTSHESLLANLERFIKSTNTMTHTVMIPSRLMDLGIDEIAISDKLLSDVCHLPHPVTATPVTGATINTKSYRNGVSGGTIDEDTSSISSCDSSSSFDQISTSLVYSNGNNNNNNGPDQQPQLPNPPTPRAMSKSGSTSTLANVNHSNKLDMYTAYKMLVTARNDLVWSSTLEEEPFVVGGGRNGGNSADESVDDLLDCHSHTQHILMVKFKHHLDALNDLMAQFAELAEALTSKYEMHENMD